jgi:hypothetical protein
LCADLSEQQGGIRCREIGVGFEEGCALAKNPKRKFNLNGICNRSPLLLRSNKMFFGRESEFQ